MHQWTFKVLPDLPEPPTWLIDRIDRAYRPGTERYSPDSREYLSIRRSTDWRKQSYDWIQPMASNGNVRHYFDEESLAWVRENISDEFQLTNSGVMFFDEPQLPHTDVTRDFVLLYNIQSGGPQSKLCFWREEGQSLVRERMVAVERGPNLKLVDSVYGPFNNWYIVNAKIIHSVEGVSGLRLNLQVSFDVEIPALFRNKYF